MPDPDRLKRLQAIRDALQAGMGASPTAPAEPEESAPAEPEPGAAPPPVPQAALSPFAPEQPEAAPPVSRGIPADGACPTCLQPLDPSDGPCPRCAPRRQAGGGVWATGNMVSIPGKTRGPDWLATLHMILTPVAEVETELLVGVSLILLVVGGCVAIVLGTSIHYNMVDRTWAVPVRRLVLLTPAVPLALRLLAEAVWRRAFIPGVSVTLSKLQWSPGERRVLLLLEVVGDARLTGDWRKAIRVALDPADPLLAPLFVETERHGDGCRRDFTILAPVRKEKIEGALLQVQIPDGRRLGLEIPALRFREAPCGRCGGEDPSCSLCGGVGRVQNALL